MNAMASCSGRGARRQRGFGHGEALQRATGCKDLPSCSAMCAAAYRYRHRSLPVKKKTSHTMKLNALLFAAACVVAPVFSQAAQIQVADAPVHFEAPEGFKAVPQDLIALKWPSHRAPRFVVGNERATTTVAYDIKPHRIPQDQLPEVQQSFTGLMERMVPGIRWINNELIELAGQRWLLMEMSSNAVDTDIHNIMLITGIGEQMLIFNFNSTKEEFPKVETALRKSLRSISISR